VRAVAENLAGGAHRIAQTLDAADTPPRRVAPSMMSVELDFAVAFRKLPRPASKVSSSSRTTTASSTASRAEHLFQERPSGSGGVRTPLR